MRKNLTTVIIAACLCAFVSTMVSADTGSSAPPTFNEAVKDYNSGDYRKALIKFQKFRDANPSNLVVRYYQGLCYQGLNALSEAREEFSFVVQNDTGDLRAKAKVGLDRLAKAKTLDSSRAAAVDENSRLGHNVSQVLIIACRKNCKECRAAGDAWNEVEKLLHLGWQQLYIEDGDPRLERYKVQKRHPYMIILGDAKPGTNVPSYAGDNNYQAPPGYDVVWQGKTPTNPKTILNIIQKL
jgi:tetratricopeptide (TPR) repeat protein